MALPIRPQAITTCLRNAWSSSPSTMVMTGTITFRHQQQQIRGKQKMANNSATVHVRLLKNVSTFGRKGAIVPVTPGKMRNTWFPERVAEYIPRDEMKTLRATDVTMERDFAFSTVVAPVSRAASTTLTPELEDASMFQKRRTAVQALSPERSLQLLEIFVPAHLDFYRQPIIEEKPAAPPAPAEPTHRLTGAAADLLAVRSTSPLPVSAKPQGQQGIYGSVSTQDILAAVRESVARNDEAARILLSEADIAFVEHPAKSEEADATRVKHTGEYTVEITVKGAEVPVRRTVKVFAQDL